jgi:CxxC motif-containing protein
MNEMKQITCICCPRGCRITAGRTPEFHATGQACKRGLDYAREELISPKRTVTAVVRTDSDEFRYAPVKTDRPLDMKRIDALLKELYRLRISLPREIGSVILKDFRGTGVNVVVTRSLPAS